ncbi:MAG: group II intron maturase-specific domain-containing protein [Sandaracinus sp.]
MQRTTMRSRFTRAIGRVRDWCRINRHLPIAEQCKALGHKLRGHFGYYGITGNSEALSRFAYEVERAWHKWLCRRSQRPHLPWARFNLLLARYPLPPPRVVHSVFAPNAASP